MNSRRLFIASLCVMAMLVGGVQAGKGLDSLKKGTPDLKSAGALAFAPEGILLVGDSTGAAVFAIDTGDRVAKDAQGKLEVQGLTEKLAGLLGTESRQIQINDLAVNPLSGNAYLSVTRGQGADALPVLLRLNRSGKIEELSLKNVAFSKAAIQNAPAPDAKDRRGRPLRVQSITDLDYTDGNVYIAGLSNEEFSSTLRVTPFPFTELSKGTGVKIFHGAHGRYETSSPVRTLTSYDLDGDSTIMASYTCTPLVKFPVKELKPGANVTGTTIAELGNRNRPLDMVPYTKDGKNYLLIANSARGVMKVDMSKAKSIEGITEKIRGTAGVPYETIEGLKDVSQLAKLDAKNALILVETDTSSKLETIPLP